jgi:hypothetical protein
VPTTSDPLADAAAFRRRSPLIAAAIVGVVALAIGAILFVRAGGSAPEAAPPSDSPAVTSDSRPAAAPLDGAQGSQAAPVEPAPTPLPTSQPAAPEPAVKTGSTSKAPTGAKAPPVVRPTPKVETKPAPIGPQKTAKDVFGGQR